MASRPNTKTYKKTAVKRTSMRSTTRPKSRVGGSNLAKNSSSPLFSKRNGLIAAGLAAIAGIVFVALSFAGGTPDYQYSVSAKCAGQQASQSCKDKSAEAAVYRMYKGVLGWNPDSAGYQYWVQLYAGDRVPTTTVMNRFLAQSAPKAKLAPLASDEQFVAYLQKNFTGKTTPVTASNYWVKQLQQRKLTRNDVVRKFVFLSESIKYSQPGFNAYLASAAPVAVKQTALAAQTERARKASVYTSAITKELASAKAKFKIVDDRYRAAKKLGDQRQSEVSQTDIANATANAVDAKKYAEQVKIHYVKAQDAWNKNKAIMNEAERVAKRSPDITASTVVRNGEAGRRPTEEARKLNSQAQTRVGWSNQAVAQAKQKYSAEQARLAEIRRQQELAAQQVGQENSSENSGNTTPGPTDGQPTAPQLAKWIAPSSFDCRPWNGYFKSVSGVTITCKRTVSALNLSDTRPLYKRPQNIRCNNNKYKVSQYSNNTYSCKRKLFGLW